MAIKKIEESTAVALNFIDKDTFRKAVSIGVNDLPNHEFAYVGKNTIIMNEENEKYFKDLKYKKEEVLRSDQISQKELAKLRH
jgi:hypothetical protein